MCRKSNYRWTGLYWSLPLALVLLNQTHADQVNVLPFSWSAYNDITIHSNLTTDAASSNTLWAGNLSIGADRAFMTFELNDFLTATAATFYAYYQTGTVYGGAALYQVTPSLSTGFQYNDPAVWVGMLQATNQPSGQYYSQTVSSVSVGATNYFSIRGTAESFPDTQRGFSSSEGFFSPYLTVSGTLKTGQTIQVISSGALDDQTFHTNGSAASASTNTLTGGDLDGGLGCDRAFVAFAVPPVSFLKARLFFYFNAGSSKQYGGANIRKLSAIPANWSYNGTNGVDAGTLMFGLPGSGWYWIDVTSKITAGTTNCFCLFGTEPWGGTGKTFDSAQGANPPYLWLNFAGPTIQNTAVSNITATSATVYGTLSSTGTAATTVFLFSGPADGGTNTAAWANTNQFPAPQGIGTLSTNIALSGTSPVYYFRYYATNAYGSSWAGSSMSFITGAVTIVATDPAASEIGPDTGTFTLTRPPDATNAALTVNVTIGGTAINGVDYAALPQTLIIPASSNRVTLTVTPIPDKLFEPAKTVLLTLSPGGYKIGAPNADTVVIASDAITTWTNRAQISFTGYTRSETLTNFPALIVLGTPVTGFQYNQFQSGSNADLRFADSTRTNELSYEVDEWNTNGDSLVWVKIPQLAPSNTMIWALWGKSGLTAPAYRTNGATWSGGYGAVWHLNGTDNLRDSSTNGLLGAVAGSPTTTNGVVGHAVKFNGGSDSVSANATGVGITFGEATVECWVNVPSSFAIDWRNWWELAGNGGQVIAEIHTNNNTGIAFLNGDGGFTNGLVGYVGSVSEIRGSWHHLAFTMSSSSNADRLYVDGQRVMTNTYSAAGAVTNICLGTAKVRTGPRDIQSGMDEFRISTSARSSNWIWACWMNMASNNVFATTQYYRLTGTVFICQ